MLRLLRSWMPGVARAAESLDAAPAAPTSEVAAAGAAPFLLAPHLSHASGFPIVDWSAAGAWVDSIPDAAHRSAAWTRVERAWLEHLRESLGPTTRLRESDDAFLLSSLDAPVAQATLAYVSKTLQRVVRVLDGIAQVPDRGKEILIVFDDDGDYYRYVSQYYPSDGEFAGSGGMYIDPGCGHYATVQSDLRTVEPVIAHELTHGCVGHLPIPAWLNEGLAVSTEQRLCPPPPALLTPRQMHAKHLDFWGAAEVQEFWSGQSFLRAGDSNLLSYDLARILVSQLSGDWPRFRAFVLDADLADAGAASAAAHLQLGLGELVGAILESDEHGPLEPAPGLWHAAPERGAF